MKMARLGEIAYARSGDKGASANIGVIARTPAGYEFLKGALSSAKVKAFFAPMGVHDVIRYELPNLDALNFILTNILDGGGSVTLRNDAQGKALGQMLLEMTLEVPDEALSDLIAPATEHGVPL